MPAAFRALVAGQAAANFGDALAVVSVVTLVYRATGSAAFAALYPLVRVVAGAAAGLIFPAVAARMRLQTVLIAAQGGQVLFLASLAATAVLAAPHPAVLARWYALTFAAAFLDGWTTPARNALVPRLVEETKLVQANSVLATVDQMVLLVGWLAGGVLVAQLGAVAVLWGAVALYAGATLALFGVREPQERSAAPPSTPKPHRAAKAGWTALWHVPTLRLVTAMDVAEHAVYGVWIGALLLVYVEQALGRGAEWWGYLNAGYYAGTILGGLLVWRAARWVERRLFESMIAGSALVGLLTLGFAVTSVPAVALTLCLLMGPAFQLRDVAQRTLVQRSVDAHLLPAVLAAHGILMNAAFAVSVAGMGLVADILGIRGAYGVAALVSGVTAALAFGWTRRGEPGASPGKSGPLRS